MVKPEAPSGGRESLGELTACHRGQSVGGALGKIASISGGAIVFISRGVIRKSFSSPIASYSNGTS